MSELVDKINSGAFVLIAEIGVNYYDIAKQNGISNMEAAKLMCLKAKQAGINAVKFQTYKAERLVVKNSPSYWDVSEESTTSQYELFKKYDSLGQEDYYALSEYCKKIGIDFCSTAFDFESANFLDPMMDVYKISSSDLTNLPFIEHQARKGKPVIMSVGAGNLKEIKAAVKVVRSVNDQPLVLCHCVLEYPTPYEHANLSRITSLKKEFPDLIIGYSDHCKPDESFDVIKTAYSLGATVIEKHFTLDKTLKGNDHYHSMDPRDAKEILHGVAFIEKILGCGELKSSETEAAARLNARRSIVSVCDIPAGELIRREMLTFKRPGTGIPPSRVDELIGKTAHRKIKKDSIIEMNMLSAF